MAGRKTRKKDKMVEYRYTKKEKKEKKKRKKKET